MRDSVLIIAEAGVNHNGDIELAKNLGAKGIYLSENPAFMNLIQTVFHPGRKLN